MNIKNIKLIACDLDGTLIPEETHYLDPRFRDIVLRCHELGIQFVIASGRQINDLISVIDLDDPDLIYLASNGAVIRENQGMDPIINVIPRERVKAVADRILAERDTELTMNAPYRTYVIPRSEAFHDLAGEVVAEEVIALEHFDEVPEPIVKLSLFTFDDASVYDKAFREAYTPEFNVALSGRRWLDFTYTNKGEALARIAADHGVAPEETLVFGDNFNDLPMIDFAGYGVTVPTAAEPIKAAADEVTENVVDYLEKQLAVFDTTR